MEASRVIYDIPLGIFWASIVGPFEKQVAFRAEHYFAQFAPYSSRLLLRYRTSRIWFFPFHLLMKSISEDNVRQPEPSEVRGTWVHHERTTNQAFIYSYLRSAPSSWSGSRSMSNSTGARNWIPKWRDPLPPINQAYVTK